MTIAAEQDLDTLNTMTVTFDRLQPQLDNSYIPWFGDSITAEQNTNAISPKIVNMGINGSTMRDFFGRANRSAISGSPLARRTTVGCVWALGLNDTQYEDQHGSPQNPPYLIDLFAAWATDNWLVIKIRPVNETMYSGVTNAQIDAVNAEIDTKFGGRAGFTVIDLKSTLAPSGQLLPAYTIDGVHLSAAGVAAEQAVVAPAGHAAGFW